MYDEGYTSITSNDISETCIENMKKRNEGIRPEMKWDVMDILDMSLYKDGQFDMIIDKSTIDAILCGAQAYANVATMMNEC